MRDWLFARRLLCPATDAAAADATTKGATDLAAGSTIAPGAADAAALGAAGTDAAGLGAIAPGAADAAALGAVTDAGGVGTASAALPTIDVTATPLGGGASGDLGVGPIVGGAGGGAGALGLMGTGGNLNMPTEGTTAANTAEADANAPAAANAVDPDLVQALGLDQPTVLASDAGDATGLSPVAFDPSSVTLGADPINTPSTLDQFGNWISQPKNALTAGELGLTGFGALQSAKLTSAAKTALADAGPAAQQAQMTIATGGTGSPLWAAQKSAIDASIDQQIANATASMQQTMATAGMGNQNSGIVKEQTAAITAQLNVDRQQLYEQALQQIVNQAVSELTGANSTLMAIANMQMNQDRFALQLAATGAQLAARLQQLSS